MLKLVSQKENAIQRINESKNWLFEKINKIYTQISQKKEIIFKSMKPMMKRNITTDTEEIQRIIDT